MRRDGAVLYVKNPGAAHEVPYVQVDGVWKLSLRDVLLTAVKARFGPEVAVEESDLHVLAGKMAKVVRGRAESLSELAESVRARRVRSAEELRKAVEVAAMALNAGGVMQKDAHLVEAALATEHTVTSLDDKARGWFAESSARIPKLRRIVWVNPDRSTEEPIQWLREGAKREATRTLARHRKPKA